jgi:hypothetical protein
MSHLPDIDRRLCLGTLMGAAGLALCPLPDRAWSRDLMPGPRPYGPNALWNRPVAGMPLHPESQRYVDILWNGHPTQPGRVQLTFEDFTYPVYEATPGLKLYTVRCGHPDWGNMHRKKLPWTPAWKPSHGFWTGDDAIDSQVIVLDPTNGREWNLWQVRAPDRDARIVRCGSASLIAGSYWTREIGYGPPRGCGIQCLAMLTRPWEVAAGKIEHALSMPFRGIDKRAFVAPATKTDGPTAQFAVKGGVPSGTRFALRASPLQLEEWAAALPLTEIGRASALVIGRALVEYGWIVTDNSGINHLQMEDRASGGVQWTALGLGKAKTEADDGKWYPRDLLDGLLQEEMIYAVKAP